MDVAPSIFEPPLELPLEGRKAVTVYGASSQHLDPEFFAAARRVGELQADNGVVLITGGGAQGLMGAVNDGAIAAGGAAIGVIPQFMADKGWGHQGLSHMHVAESMHRRKLCMAQNADAVIALPGGVGTLDELMEIITWRQLGLYSGRVVILNTLGYYRPLLSMLAEAQDLGFMRKGFSDNLFTVADTPQQAVDQALNIQ